jgi:hypothetical protein
MAYPDGISLAQLFIVQYQTALTIAQQLATEGN